MKSELIYWEALQKIAAGEGYYGAQAREYKQIAKAAIAAARAVDSKDIRIRELAAQLALARASSLDDMTQRTKYMTKAADMAAELGAYRASNDKLTAMLEERNTSIAALVANLVVIGKRVEALEAENTELKLTAQGKS